MSMSVFVTGGTGYIGRPLISALLTRGHAVHALVRTGSEGKVPAGTVTATGNALDESTFASSIPPAATLVHLVGTPHPNPTKAAEFQNVDLRSIRATVAAARQATVRHLVYVSVAHPAPVMQAYIAVRQEGEAAVRATGIPATILRPWYVLGPGHYWPYVLLPAYAVLRWVPSTRAGAERLGLVTRQAMVAALVSAVEKTPVVGITVMEVPEIRRAAFGDRAGS
ncbi:MAG TPA: NAD(P)H-binding protein [Vicinamibacterales bacterium]|jgi:uncharacterized protein YbjT (DUF2867 family)